MPPDKTIELKQTLEQVDALEQLLDMRVPASQLISGAPGSESGSGETDFENLAGDIEDLSNWQEWYFVPAPSLNILRMQKLKPRKRQIPSPVSGIKFREINFSKSAASPSVSSTSSAAPSVHRIRPASTPTSPQSEQVQSDETLLEIESLMADPNLAVKNILPASSMIMASLLDHQSDPISSYGFSRSVRVPTQNSVSSSIATASTTTTGSISPYRFGTPKLPSASTLSHGQKQVSTGPRKARSIFRLSSKPRAQSENVGSNGQGYSDENENRASSDSTVNLNTTSNKTHSHLAPYGDKPNSPYYVLTSMGVKLVTPGKGDPDELNTIVNNARKDSTSSGGSSASAKWFGKRSKTSQSSQGSVRS
ncbi:hypothetical protein V1512DRAFT_267464 [Lipomyces arxii]|uniref:uncharacterized protein n=1 Tax=Lipomyces arxii TaxID=56418 RepID=UPI0034CF5DFC